MSFEKRSREDICEDDFNNILNYIDQANAEIDRLTKELVRSENRTNSYERELTEREDELEKCQEFVQELKTALAAAEFYMNERRKMDEEDECEVRELEKELISDVEIDIDDPFDGQIPWRHEVDNGESEATDDQHN